MRRYYTEVKTLWSDLRDEARRIAVNIAKTAGALGF